MSTSASFSQPRPPFLSLVVCTVGRDDVLHRLFASLAGQSVRDFEVVLVDQNEGRLLDSVVADYAGRFPIRHLRSSPGLSAARNVGLRACAGEGVGFPDDDCWYPADAVARIVALFTERGFDGFNGRTVDADGRDSINAYAKEPTVVGKANIWTTHNSNALFLRRAVVERLGGFDPALGVGAKTPFQSGEEVDLILRVIRDGTVVHYVPDLVIHHDQVADSFGEKQIDRARRYAPGFGRVLRVHDYGLGYLGYRLARTCAGAGLALARGDLPKLRYKVAWARGTASGYFASVEASERNARTGEKP